MTESIVGPTPLPVEVPAVTDLDVEDAKARLAELGFGVTETGEEVGSGEPGRVLRQSPAAGELVDPGRVVQLYVSREPAAVVPTVDGNYD